MQSLKVSLFLSFERSKSHCWSRGGLSDGLCVDDITLVRLNVRLHKLGRDEPYLVPERLDLPRNPLRPCARFHPDDRWSSPLEELKQRVPSEPNPLDDRTVAAQRHDVEDVLTNINPIDRRGTRHIAFRHRNLLWFGRLMMRQEDEADHPINDDDYGIPMQTYSQKPKRASGMSGVEALAGIAFLILVVVCFVT